MYYRQVNITMVVLSLKTCFFFLNKVNTTMVIQYKTMVIVMELYVFFTRVLC